MVGEVHSGKVVWVRRQWNDYRDAAYHIEDIEGWHWSTASGGVNASAPRPFIHS